MLQLTAIGHIGKDAELKTTAGGKSVVNFSVAHSEKFTNAAGTKTEKTTWLDCSLWEKDNLAPYLKKGTLVMVQGNPEAHPYRLNNGDAAASLRLRVMRVELLGAKKDGTGNADNGTTTTETAPEKEPFTQF